MEIQKAPNSQSILKKNGSSGIDWLQYILERFIHQYSMVLVQKLEYRPIGQGRKLINKCMYIGSPYL